MTQKSSSSGSSNTNPHGASRTNELTKKRRERATHGMYDEECARRRGSIFHIPSFPILSAPIAGVDVFLLDWYMDGLSDGTYVRADGV
ncbi:glutamic pyruvic transaminase 1 [Anopheles sinensis]|uniref:Glutamic pyruvic transaminase 1 n=1 Tax=Anopheles sinensis TaxID=74873 RepID=A0A084WRB4_ANOSI|nr:glutamic pyruvic transaminase 1 [Anopheles sinensis]